MNRINIAIDGFSGCGKSTLARQLAKAIGYVFVDTGAMYRAFTFLVIKEGQNRDPISAVINSDPRIEFNEMTEVIINGQNQEKAIRGIEVANRVSEIASDARVRNFLFNLQNQLIESKGVVMEGRDIGSVIIPNAELKLFITANIETRVERRYHQQGGDSQSVTRGEFKTNLLTRDQKDIEREAAPLKLVAGAIVMDTTFLTEKEQLKMAMCLATPKMNPSDLLGMVSPK